WQDTGRGWRARRGSGRRRESSPRRADDRRIPERAALPRVARGERPAQTTAGRDLRLVGDELPGLQRELEAGRSLRPPPPPGLEPQRLVEGLLDSFSLRGALRATVRGRARGPKRGAASLLFGFGLLLLRAAALLR